MTWAISGPGTRDPGVTSLLQGARRISCCDGRQHKRGRQTHPTNMAGRQELYHDQAKFPAQTARGFPIVVYEAVRGGWGNGAECTRYGKCTAGVVEYWCFDPSGKGVLRPGQDHLCLLLHSDPFDHYAEWEKVSTEELLFIQTDTEVKRDLSMLRL